MGAVEPATRPGGLRRGCEGGDAGGGASNEALRPAEWRRRRRAGDGCGGGADHRRSGCQGSCRGWGSPVYWRSVGKRRLFFFSATDSVRGGPQFESQVGRRKKIDTQKVGLGLGLGLGLGSPTWFTRLILQHPFRSQGRENILAAAASKQAASSN